MTSNNLTPETIFTWLSIAALVIAVVGLGVSMWMHGPAIVEGDQRDHKS